MLRVVVGYDVCFVILLHPSPDGATCVQFIDQLSTATRYSLAGAARMRSEVAYQDCHHQHCRLDIRHLRGRGKPSLLIVAVARTLMLPRG